MAAAELEHGPVAHAQRANVAAHRHPHRTAPAVGVQGQRKAIAGEGPAITFDEMLATTLATFSIVESLRSGAPMPVDDSAWTQRLGLAAARDATAVVSRDWVAPDRAADTRTAQQLLP